MNDLETLPPEQLRQLRDRSDIGEPLKERINRVLEGVGEVKAILKQAMSTDPRDRMTLTEKRMADVLDLRKRQGEIVEWWFECMTFRVGVDRTRYTPDFVAQLPNGHLEVIEVKGAQVWDDSKVKIKAAALLYHFARWRMMQWTDGAWKTVYDFAARNTQRENANGPGETP